jgi:superfamily II DNA or RNA helicase
MSRETIQKEALDITMKHKRCGLGISMGVGKTRIALQHLIKNYHPMFKYLVVVPKNSIIDSWNTEIDKMVDQFKELSDENYEIDLDLVKQQMQFVNYRSINKLDPSSYNIVYLDECHNLLYSHEEFLSKYSNVVLGLTGTPPVNKGSEKYNMVQKYCPIVYNFTVDQATDNKILNDYKIVIHKLNLSGVPSLKKKNKKGGYWFTSEQKDYTYCNQRYNTAVTAKQQQFAAIMRMRALMEYNTKEVYVKSLLKNATRKTIVFANTQAQADRICSHSYHSGNSQSDYNLELFSDGRIDSLSCVLQLSEGVSIPNLEQGIIMHAYGNERKTAQRIGRLLRLSPHKVATCHILCYANTVDEKWIDNALKTFDASKIVNHKV